MSLRSTPLVVDHGVDKETLFNPDIRAAIDAQIAKYPPEWKQSAVMAALSIVQDANGGWLTTELMDAVAAYLDMPKIAVYEVATFYSMYDLKPQGRHKVCICNSISCMLNGSEELLAHIEQRYGVRPGEMSADGRFSLKEVECLGACRDAPVVMIDKVYHERLTPETLERLIEGLE